MKEEYRMITCRACSVVSEPGEYQRTTIVNGEVREEYYGLSGLCKGCTKVFADKLNHLARERYDEITDTWEDEIIQGIREELK